MGRDGVRVGGPVEGREVAHDGQRRGEGQPHCLGLEWGPGTGQDADVGVAVERQAWSWGDTGIARLAGGH